MPGKQGTAVDRIAWSPDSSWLAFTGRQQDTWTAQSMRIPGLRPARRSAGSPRRAGDGRPIRSRRPTPTPGSTIDDSGTIVTLDGRLEIVGKVDDATSTLRLPTRTSP